MEYNYNQPITADKIEVLGKEDNGKSRKTGFKYEGNYYRLIYNYGKGYGFSFIESYANENNYLKPLSTTGNKTIYGTMERDCTDLGKFLEYSIMKNNLLKCD